MSCSCVALRTACCSVCSVCSVPCVQRCAHSSTRRAHSSTTPYSSTRSQVSRGSLARCRGPAGPIWFLCGDLSARHVGGLQSALTGAGIMKRRRAANLASVLQNVDFSKFFYNSQFLCRFRRPTTLHNRINDML